MSNNRPLPTTPRDGCVALFLGCCSGCGCGFPILLAVVIMGVVFALLALSH